MIKRSNSHSEMFFSSFIDDLNKSRELVSETLKSCNLNEQEIADNANAIAGRLLAQMRINTAKKTKVSLMQRAMELMERTQTTIQTLNPHDRLFTLLTNNVHNAAFTFSNLKQFSYNDIIQMLSELELLELIEELEKKNNI